MRVSAKIGVAVLSVLMILAPVHRLRAQFAVFDPVQTAASAIDALNQLFETMEEFDWIGDQWDEFNNMKSWFNNNFGEGSWYESFQDLMKDLDSFQRMGRQLEASARVSQMYATRLKNMAADGRFNPQYINGLQRQLLREFELIGNMVNQAGVIMRRNDIDRNEKIHLLDEASNRIATTARQTRDNAAHTGNVTTPSLPALQDRGNLSYGEAMGEHEGTFVEGSRNAFGAVTVALGILCALFLIVALAKFLKGEPGSEVVFLRIGVALLGGVAFLTILTKAFGF